jgi:hypothetical protein
MKKLMILAMATGIFMSSFAQDTTGKDKVDTIRIGGMIIIKKKGTNVEDSTEEKKDRVIIRTYNSQKKSNVSTNWLIVDLGFANWRDQTDYSSAEAQAFAPGLAKGSFKLRTGKTVNVNIWAFMQKLNVYKHVVNLKYGIGVELNNYRFEDTRLRLLENPTKIVLDSSWSNLTKNKLAADYLTVPMMINFNFTPNMRKGFGLSAGISAGYLYSSRQKIKDKDGNKTKFHDDFDLERWKLSWIGELNLGPIRLYGSYAFKSMWAKGLDQTPYNFGIRLSNW